MAEHDDTPEPTVGRLFRPGHSCWRVARATRAAPLVDAAAYFTMLAETMRRAEHEIFIVGWDVHALACLERGAGPSAERGPNLRETLAALATERPGLAVRILLWDFTVLYASDRLPFPKAVLDWSMPANVSLALDNRLPVGGSHHQKVVVVDDRVAFVGGMDLTEKRWDTPAHAAGDARRVTSRGEAYPPFHDVQLAVEGEAAAALGTLCRERWTRCTGEAPPPVAGPGRADAWPEAFPAHWHDVDVAIARTLPATRDDDEPVDEILNLYLDSIAAAERHIYIENQYLTAERICDALVERLAEPDGPEIVIVTQTNTHSWLEENTMGVRRRRFLARLGRGDAHGRLRVLAPQVPGIDIDDYKLHSKLMIVDDALVRIGSANLNNRSMGFDSECDAVVSCRSDTEQVLASRFRSTLLGEHLGCAADDVERAVAAHGSLCAAVDTLAGGERTLVPIDVGGGEPGEPEIPGEEMLAEIADRDQPLTAQELLDRLAPESRMPLHERAERTGLKLAAALGVIVAIAFVWQLTGLDELVEPEVFARVLEAAPGGVVGALTVLAAFVVGGLVVFPVTALIFATALTYGPWLGLAYSIVGTYVSAAVTFGAGRWLGERPLTRWSLTPVAAVSRQLARRGVLAIAVLRIVPVAPFTVINVLAGASEIRFRDYMIGTLLGMTPGIIVLTALGGQLAALLREPSLLHILAFGVLGVLWIGLGLALQRFVNRIERRRNTREPS